MAASSRRQRRSTCLLLLLLSAPISTALSPWIAYKSWLTQRPLLTKSVTSGILATCSDVLAQSLEASRKEQKQHDAGRSLQVATTGLVYSGPMAHCWYQFMETTLLPKLLLPSGTSSMPTSLATRLTLDAILFSPATILGYFTVRTMLERRGFSALKSKLRKAYMPSLMTAWKFWPLVNIFNFLYIPLQYRVLYANILSLLWTGYLSLINSRSSASS